MYLLCLHSGTKSWTTGRRLEFQPIGWVRSGKKEERDWYSVFHTKEEEPMVPK